MNGTLRLTVDAFMPIPQSWSAKRQRMAIAGLIRPTTRPDFDNILKTLDAFNQVVWTDDARVVEVQFAKHYSERPRLVVTVEALL